MKKVVIEIDVDNAAFHDGGPFAFTDETARILRALAVRFESLEKPTSAYDINGNTVCSVKYIKS